MILQELSPEHEAKIRRLRTDYRLFAEHNLKIKTKSGIQLPLIFNDAQTALHKAISKQYFEHECVRVLGLKGRQQGFSTYTEGRAYWRTVTNRNKRAYILTHEQKATDNLFEMAKYFYEHSFPFFKPQLTRSNAKEMKFSGLNSTYALGTAGAKATGRSQTLQFLHASEAAHWPNADEIYAGVMQAVPTGDERYGTEVIIETTANGVGGKFHELWQNAINGANEFMPVFIPWYLSKEYRLADAKIEPTPKELRYMLLHGVTLEQIAWRRLKIMELGEALCNQEYPYTSEEAFISSGRCAFDLPLLSIELLNTFNPEFRMTYSHSLDRFIERDDGELKVWDMPEANKRYVIGADVAEGLEHGDFSSADVLEYPSGYQVAQWHGHVSADVFGTILAALGTMYNKAFIGVECNNHGLTTNVKLRDSNYPYLYVERDLDNSGSGAVETRRIGWLTTKKSKYLIIDQLASEIRDKTHGIACRDTIQEMMSYIVKPNGSFGADLNCFDDRVMSRAIAGEMLKSLYR